MVVEYWQKQDKQKLYDDLIWNLPERPSGRVAIIGGNAQNFAREIKLAEWLEKQGILREICVVLPDSLKKVVPDLPNIKFVSSTAAGTLKKSLELEKIAAEVDFNLIAGDLSKNAETAQALVEIGAKTQKPWLLARDAVDLVAERFEDFVERENLWVMASLAQWQKIFQALYYPKRLLLSAPLLQIVETAHKFSLSFPELTVVTLHQAQILVARAGQVATVPLAAAGFSPLSLWQGELAAKIMLLNLFNPNQNFSATVAAINWLEKS